MEDTMDLRKLVELLDGKPKPRVILKNGDSIEFEGDLTQSLNKHNKSIEEVANVIHNADSKYDEDEALNKLFPHKKDSNAKHKFGSDEYDIIIKLVRLVHQRTQPNTIRTTQRKNLVYVRLFRSESQFDTFVEQEKDFQEIKKQRVNIPANPIAQHIEPETEEESNIRNEVESSASRSKINLTQMEKKTDTKK